MDSLTRRSAIAIICALIFFVGGLFALSALLSESPYLPLFTASASISGYNLTADGHLTSNFDVHVTSFNPNSFYSIHYKNLNVSVYNDGTLLADELFTNVFLSRPKMKPMKLDLGLGVYNMLVSDGVAENLKMAGKSSGEARLEVRVSADTVIRLKGWKNFDNLATNAACSPVNVKFNSSSEALFSGSIPAYCSVNVDYNY